MKPVDQTIFGPELGNCFAACVASVLELPLEDVPNFCEGGDHGWFDRLRAWLRPRGLWALTCKLGGKPGASDGGWYPEGLHIAGGQSPRHACLHAVVARGNEIVHDPHPSRAGVLSFEDSVVIVLLDVIRSGAASE